MENNYENFQNYINNGGIGNQQNGIKNIENGGRNNYNKERDKQQMANNNNNNNNIKNIGQNCNQRFGNCVPSNNKFTIANSIKNLNEINNYQYKNFNVVNNNNDIYSYDLNSNKLNSNYNINNNFQKMDYSNNMYNNNWNNNNWNNNLISSNNWNNNNLNNNNYYSGNVNQIKKKFVDNNQQTNVDINGGTDRTISNSIKNSKISDFQHLEYLGEGFFGTVKKMRFKKDGNIYAVKEILKNRNNILYIKRLQRETGLTENLDHQNIVKVYGSFEEYDKMYIVLEYIDGINLEKYIIEKKGQLDENTIFLVIKDIGFGLKYLHNLNIMHRDIKPDNILLILENDKITNLKITDFGEAALYIENKDFNYKEYEYYIYCMTKAGRKDYCAPEITKGEKYNVSVDIYSFGLLLIQMMLPIQTFEITKNGKKIIRLKTRKVAKKEDFNKKLYSDELIELTLKMIDDDYKKRPSAKRICDEIEEMIIKKQKSNNENKCISFLNCFCCILYNIAGIRSYLLSEDLSSNNVNYDEKNIFLIRYFRYLFKELHKVKKQKIKYQNFYSDLKFYRKILSKKLNSFNLCKEINPIEMIDEIFEKFHSELKLADNNKYMNVMFNNIHIFIIIS